jgi:hypothetical protein
MCAQTKIEGDNSFISFLQIDNDECVRVAAFFFNVGSWKREKIIIEKRWKIEASREWISI